MIKKGSYQHLGIKKTKSCFIILIIINIVSNFCINTDTFSPVKANLSGIIASEKNERLWKPENL